MTASRLVMQEWAEGFREISDKSGVTVDSQNGYIDDARQNTDLMFRGVRYNPERKRFTWREDWEREDEEQDLPDEVRMGKICQVAMNAVNEDLEFTIETVYDFEN